MRDISGPPPLTSAEVSAAEGELGVCFPGEYRAYLLGVSAGGPVHRLERTERGWWWAGNADRRRELLAVAFPHPDSYVEADNELFDRKPQKDSFPEETLYAEAWQIWDQESEAFAECKTAGAVIAQHHGCGFAALLVVTGPLAGTMWWDGRASCDLIVPLSLDHAGGVRPVTFGEWLTHRSSNLLPPDWGRR